MCSTRLLFHDVDPVEVFLVFALCGYHSAGRNSRLGDHMVQHCPIVLFFVEVVHTGLLNAVRDADINTVGR